MIAWFRPPGFSGTMKSCEQHIYPSFFCHSERNEESYGAQGTKLPEGEESSPCANAHGDEKRAIDMPLICDIDLM